MNFDAMLATSIKPDKLSRYATNDDWWFEQKLDGVRLGILVDGHHAEAWNRRGSRVMVEPEIIDVFQSINGRWVFDGEWIAGVFWIFDLPEAVDKINNKTPYRIRRVALEVVTERLETASDLIRVLPTHRTTEAKVDLVRECYENHAEGIMVKNVEGLYWGGKRSPQMLKAKFVETVDCIVTEVGREGKRSISIAVYNDGELQRIGACTVSERQLPTLTVGDVVELKYLYATKDHKIYQASFLRLRDDKPATDCTIDQLKYTNKAILAN